MAQLSPTGGYILIGPDGTRAVFNAPADPDFVGYLDPTNGITGLLDTADVIESFAQRVEGDGATQGNQYLGRRTGSLQGIILSDPNPTATNANVTKLKRASRAMKGGSPAQLLWTPDGGAQQVMFVYRQGRVAITGRRPKNFVLPLSSPFEYVYSAALHSVSLPLGAVLGDLGFSSPISSPFGTVYNATAQGFISNAGDAPAWPIFVLNGPMTNPVLLNNTTGLSWMLTASIAQGSQMVVDTYLRTVTLQTPLTFGNTPNNYVPNPGFEYDAVGSAPLGYGNTINAAATRTVVASNAFTGSNSQRVVTPGSAGNEGTSILLNNPPGGLFLAGVTYRIDVYITGGTGGESIQVLITNSATTDFAAISPVLTSGRVRYGVNWTPAANQTTVYAVVRNAGTSAYTYYIDALQVSQANSAQAYVDGDSGGYAWQGTPGNSSTIPILTYQTANRYSTFAANFLRPNTWWPLIPSANDVRLQLQSSAYPASAVVQWRDTFE